MPRATTYHCQTERKERTSQVPIIGPIRIDQKLGGKERCTKRGHDYDPTGKGSLLDVHRMRRTRPHVPYQLVTKKRGLHFMQGSIYVRRAQLPLVMAIVASADRAAVTSSQSRQNVLCPVISDIERSCPYVRPNFPEVLSPRLLVCGKRSVPQQT